MIKTTKFLFKKFSLLTLCLGLFSLNGLAQQNPVAFGNGGFEENNLIPWTISSGNANLSSEVIHSGKQAIELNAGTAIKHEVVLKPQSMYKITAWLKTASGSGEVALQVHGLGENNAAVSSALAGWSKVEINFVTGAKQSTAVVIVNNPENAAGNKAWADDISLTYTGVNKSEAGRLPARAATRNPKTDLGIEQQPNDKLNWLYEARFGMFIHWGLYSGPGQGEWYMENKGILPENYRKLAYPESGDKYFAADKFNADEWATLAKAAGMNYMSMVTMHHDGYGLFESKAANAFNSKQSHNRDFVKEYVEACRKNGLKVGLYKTLINWRYPGYYDITGKDCKPNKFGYTTDSSHRENAREMKEELYVQVKELLTNYGKIDLMFWDGGWLGQQGSDADGAYFWESGKYLDPKNPWPINPFLQDKDQQTGKALGLMGMVRKYQPDILVNPRSGWYGDFKSEEGNSPITGPVRTNEIWQKCLTMAPGWGYTPAHDDSLKVMSAGKIKRMLADCVIRNMSLLLNVGPDRHGQITKPEQNVLLEMGRWLKKVGPAIYGTKGGPWNPKDGEYGYAVKGKTIYVFLLEGFNEKKFTLPAMTGGQKVVRAYIVSDGSPISFKQEAGNETTLKNIKQTDKDVTILAVDLNKPLTLN